MSIANTANWQSLINGLGSLQGKSENITAATENTTQIINEQVQMLVATNNTLDYILTKITSLTNDTGKIIASLNDATGIQQEAISKLESQQKNVTDNLNSLKGQIASVNDKTTNIKLSIDQNQVQNQSRRGGKYVYKKRRHNTRKKKRLTGGYIYGKKSSNKKKKSIRK